MPHNQTKIARKRKLEDYSEVMKHEHSSSNYFGAFIAKPKNIQVDIQDKDEQLILVLRQHLITQVREVAILFAIIFLIPGLLSVAGFLDVLPNQFLTAFYVFWVVLSFGLIVKTFLMWFFNVYIVTDERVIDVDFNSMIYRNISSAKIENIEDISSQSIGPLASIFDYGTINLQTAGASNEFEFDNVPQPGKVKKLLNELLLEEEREKLEGRAN